MPSKAFLNFNSNIAGEVENLAETFRDKNRNRGPNTGYGMVNGGLILLISGWEIYCENVAKQAVEIMVNKETISFNNLPKTAKVEIINFANEENIAKMNINNTRIAKLAEGGWRNLLPAVVDNFVDSFNTPKFCRKGKNDLQDLFKIFLQADILQDSTSLTKIPNFVNEVDKAISVRGHIAHNGEPPTEDKFDHNGLLEYLKIIRSGCAAIDCIIHTEFNERYNFAPWRLSHKITGFLPGHEK